MREKAYTTLEFFNLIVDELKDKGMYPGILDYAISTHEDLIDTYEFSIKNDLDYGASEGIYLDLSIEFYNKAREKKVISLGTFKTLEENIKAMEIMGKLLADFIVIARKFVNEHIDDFTFEGISLIRIRDDGLQHGLNYISYNKEEAMALVKDIFQKYPDVQKVRIRDRKMRRETEISRYDD